MVLFVNKNVLFLGMVSSLYVAGHKVEPAWYFVVAVPHISQQRGRGFSAEAPWLGGSCHTAETPQIFVSLILNMHTPIELK